MIGFIIFGALSLACGVGQFEAQRRGHQGLTLALCFAMLFFALAAGGSYEAHA